jgi:hypothetical protein
LTQVIFLRHSIADICARNFPVWKNEITPSLRAGFAYCRVLQTVYAGQNPHPIIKKIFAMKNQHFLHLLLATSLLFSAYRADAFRDAAPLSKTPDYSVFELSRETLIQKDKAALELEICRKLTFKEKIALKSVKRKLKNNPELDGLRAHSQVETENLAKAGFTFGLLGLVFFPLSIAAIIFSSRALRRMKRSPEKEKGKGLAVAGLILGITPFFLAILAIAIFVSSGGGLYNFDISWP